MSDTYLWDFVHCTRLKRSDTPYPQKSYNRYNCKSQPRNGEVLTVKFPHLCCLWLLYHQLLQQKWIHQLPWREGATVHQMYRLWWKHLLQSIPEELHLHLQRYVQKPVLHAAELCDDRGHGHTLLSVRHTEGNSVWAKTHLPVGDRRAGLQGVLRTPGGTQGTLSTWSNQVADADVGKGLLSC